MEKGGPSFGQVRTETTIDFRLMKTLKFFFLLLSFNLSELRAHMSIILVPITVLTLTLSVEYCVY